MTDSRDNRALGLRVIPYRRELTDRLVLIAVLRPAAEAALRQHGAALAPSEPTGTFRVCVALDDGTPYELVRSGAMADPMIEVRSDPHRAVPETLVERLCAAIGIDDNEIEWLGGGGVD